MNVFSHFTIFLNLSFTSGTGLFLVQGHSVNSGAKKNHKSSKFEINIYDLVLKN